MLSKKMPNGFTLIELLVVVLIIGILAAVAMPQYQKAVEKSRAAQAFTLLRTFGQAQEAYYMANGQYAATFDVLDIDLPTDIAANKVGNKYENKDWSVLIQAEAAFSGSVEVNRKTGPYANAGFRYRPDFISYSKDKGKSIICYEYVATFKKEAGAYCSKIFKGTLFETTAVRKYTLP